MQESVQAAKSIEINNNPQNIYIYIIARVTLSCLCVIFLFNLLFIVNFNCVLLNNNNIQMPNMKEINVDFMCVPPFMCVV